VVLRLVFLASVVQPVGMAKVSVLGYVDKVNVLVILICASDTEKSSDN